MLSDIGLRIVMRSTTTKYALESPLTNIITILPDIFTTLPLMISRFVFFCLCSVLSPIFFALFPVCFWKFVLQYDTKYFYEIGSGDATRRFFFTTPPMVGPDVPYIFGIIGNCFIAFFLAYGSIAFSVFRNQHSVIPLSPQAILDRLMIRIKRLSIIIQIRRDKRCCSSEIFRTRIIIRFTITGNGIHGVDLLRRALRISHGFGLPVTTRWILLQKL